MIKNFIHNNPLSVTLRANKYYIKELLRTGKFFIFYQLFAIVIAAPLSYWQTYSPKKFIDSIMEGDSLVVALFWILVLIVLRYINQVNRFLVDFFKKRACAKAKIYSKRHTYYKLENILLTYFESPENLNTFNKAMSYNENGGDVLVNMFFTICTSMVSLLTMTFISFKFEWWLWIAIVLLALLQYFSDKYLKK